MYVCKRGDVTDRAIYIRGTKKSTTKDSPNTHATGFKCVCFDSRNVILNTTIELNICV